MEIELTSILDELSATEQATVISAEVIDQSGRNLSEKMHQAEIEIKAMKAESEAVAAQVFLTM